MCDKLLIKRREIWSPYFKTNWVILMEDFQTDCQLNVVFVLKNALKNVSEGFGISVSFFLVFYSVSILVSVAYIFSTVYFFELFFNQKQVRVFLNASKSFRSMCILALLNVSMPNFVKTQKHQNFLKAHAHFCDSAARS